MADKKPTTKRLQIDKANAMMVIAVAVASFVVTFSIIAARALWSQQNYQSRVIKQKKVALDQLKSNLQAAQNLDIAYKEFTGGNDNVLGGNPSGNGEKDGDNGKIVLDALPSKYDFPALVTSVETLLTKNSIAVKSIGGTDDQLNQNDKPASSPKPVEMPFTFTAGGSYQALKDLMSVTERSIRPINVQSISISGQDNDLSVTVNAITYYQSEVSLKMGTKVIK